MCLNVCEKLCHQGKRGYSQRSVHKVSCKNKMPRFQLPPVNFQAVMKATEIRLPERKMCLSHLEVSVKKKTKRLKWLPGALCFYLERITKSYLHAILEFL